MYYLELIQRLWAFNEKMHLGSTLISMYLFLLKTGYRDNSYGFNISDIIISKELGLTRKTVKSSKEKLRRLGLINYETKNGIPGSYRLILDYPLLVPEKETVEKASRVIKLPKINEAVFHGENVPTEKELCDYAKTLDGYNVQLEFMIKEKYENWVRKGWKNNSSRPITDWKSTLKSMLPFLNCATQSSSLNLRQIPNIKRPKTSDDT